MQVWLEQKTGTNVWTHRSGRPLLRTPIWWCSRNYMRPATTLVQPCTATPRRKTAPLRPTFGHLPRNWASPLHIGYRERDGQTVYNAFLFIDGAGVTLANHRKTVLPIRAEHDRFAIGTGFPIFRFADATIAIVICTNANFPESCGT